MRPAITRYPAPWRARLRRALAGAGAAAALWAVAFAAASSARVEARLRARIDGALRARAGVGYDGPVRVDPLFRISFGPLALRTPDAATPVRIERVTVRPSLPALLGGRAEAASILLGSVRVAPGPGGRDLRALLERLRRGPGASGAAGTAAEGPRPLPKLKLRNLVVELPPLRERPLSLGPVDGELRWTATEAGPRADLELGFRSGGRIAAVAERVATGWRATVRGAGLDAEALPDALRPGAAALASGALAFEATIEAPADGGRARATFSARADDVSIAGTRIGERPVGPLRASAGGTVEWDGAQRRLALRDAEAVVQGAIRIGASAELRLTAPAWCALALRAERVDLAGAIAALPRALEIPPEVPRPPGTLDASLDLEGPLLHPGEWSVAASLDLSRLREAARRGGRTALAGEFVHRPLLGEGRGRAIRIGPSNPDFVPIAELPEHVVRAVTTAEDGGFFGHSGFDFEELRNALAQGAERGRVVRGGSTITQQLAKNLFLGPERTLERKIREAVIAVALESSLPKRRLLEIYLNVAEWGPGVYGIGPAARLWFGKDARALEPKEAALLAAVIPSPSRYHALLTRGPLSEYWEERVRGILLTMATQGSLAPEVVARALDVPVVVAGAPAGDAAPDGGPLPEAPAGEPSGEEPARFQ